MTLQEDFINQCKQALLNKKNEIMNLERSYRHNLSSSLEKGGDEADQTSAHLQEQQDLSLHERTRKQLIEIENALARIENGCYGICEETGEPIEKKRLLKNPWTSLSIEGAEHRENLKKMYAHHN